MKTATRKLAEEIFKNPRMQAFFKNPPPTGPTDDGDMPATEEAEAIIDEITTTIDLALDRIETTIASLKSVTQDHVQRLKDIEESRQQAISELEAARETADHAMAKEKKATDKMNAAENELASTVKQLGNTAAKREEYKKARDELRESAKLALARVKELESPMTDGGPE